MQQLLSPALSQVLMPRPSRLLQRTSAPVAATNSCTLASPAKANDLIFAHHRRSGSGPGAGPGGTLIETQANHSLFWILATDGQTVVQGLTGVATDSMSAVAYGNSKLSFVVDNVSFANGSGTTILFPALSLREPGKSWVFMSIGLSASGVTLNSVTTTALYVASGNAPAVIQTGTRVALADSNGPVYNWPGATGTLSSGATWNVWCVEVRSAP